MWARFDGLFWFIVFLVPLVFLQRLLHRDLQAIFYMLTRHEGLTYGIFALIFFPGVLLHETSHYVMARLLGVPTGRFSILPKALNDGTLRLGYVETGRSDVVRGTLIGAAPLFSGLLFLAYVGGWHLYLFPLWDFLQAGRYSLFWQGVLLLPGVQDFCLWFYLSFVVSSTMLPSASDRHAWRSFGLLLGVLLALVIFIGGGDLLLMHVAPVLNAFLRTLSVLFALSAALHLILWLPIGLLRVLLSRLTGLYFA